jgi:hypothetical protein
MYPNWKCCVTTLATASSNEPLFAEDHMLAAKDEA